MKNEAPKYFENLEERWKINKAESERSQDDDGLLRRPKGLRASELVRELWRLYALWQDPRFKACSQALFEHEIVQGLDGDWVDGEKLKRSKLKFTSREGPILASVRQEVKAVEQVIDEFQLDVVRTFIGWGYSEQHACAEVAAEYGRPANSFAAAVEQLRHLLQKAGKRARTQKSSPRAVKL